MSKCVKSFCIFKKIEEKPGTLICTKLQTSCLYCKINTNCKL